MADYTEQDIPQFAENTLRKLETVYKMAAIELFRQVILKTPVDTGRARSNWQTEIGRFTKDEIDVIKNNETIIAEMIEKINSGTLQDGFYMANNLPYIQKLEYGGYPKDPKQGSWDKNQKQFVIKTVHGFSKQAPQGMVRISIEQIKKDLKKILDDVVRQK
jgi:hypothetical protein